MMKKITACSLFFILALASFTTGRAQQRPSLNHIALYVVDLQKSAAFYTNVMQLEPMAEPFKDGRHAWFRIGPHSQLHIIQGAAAVTAKDMNAHMCFSVKDLKQFTRRMDQLQVQYRNLKGDGKEPTVRPDGVKQVYLQDPDNYWIEVNDDRF